MSSSTMRYDPSISLSALERIHRVCCSFEHAWRSGKRERIEEYLVGAKGAERLALFQELFGFELDYRFEKGESPQADEYEARFSNDSRLLKVISEEFCRCNKDRVVKQPGDAIGHFEIVRVLGEGGLGIVYLAYDSHLELLVAIKMPRRGGVDYQRLFEEAKNAAKLEHPSIVPIHHVDLEPNGTPYIVMKHLGGGSLADLLKNQGCLEPLRAVEILQAVAKAVQFLHDRGYCHRDLKPGNILLDEKGAAFVADFGLAIHTDELRERPGDCSGTVPYMAPEQFGKESGRLADIWALGVILYEMLTGQRPFRGETTADLHDKIENSVPERFPAKDPPIPLRLVSICLKCLEKRKEDRFGRVEDLLAQLAGSGPLEQWNHKTTEDEYYVEPRRASNHLRQCLADPRIRVVTVTGIGGSGKTAFLAHGLKNTLKTAPRSTSGVFYWSFAKDSDVGRFLKSLLRFAGRTQSEQPVGGPMDLLAEAMEVLRCLPMILVLDALEVHQQGPADITPGDRSRSRMGGPLSEPQLSRFIKGWRQFAVGSLLCLASRFPIEEISDAQNGKMYPFGSSDLRLTDTEGLSLLQSCGAASLDRRELLSANRRWEGYSLGLRFSAQAGRRSAEDPGGPDKPGDAASLLREIGRFYETHLPPEQAMLLRVIAVFWRPVPADVISRVYSEIAKCDTILGNLAKAKISLELRALCQEEMLLCADVHRTGRAYVCHPALRDYFNLSCRREGYLASICQGADAAEHYDLVDYLAVELAVIQTHLERGDSLRADDVFRNQLKDGRLFLETEGAIEAGLSAVEEFVRDQQRRQLCKEQLSAERLIHHLYMAGLFSLLTGHIEDVKRYHDQTEQLGSVGQTVEVLLNHSLLWCLTGNPREGESVADQSLTIALAGQDHKGQQHSLACRGFARFLQGDTEEAADDFQRATEMACRTGADVLMGKDGVLYAIFLLRVGNAKEAERIIHQGFEASRPNHGSEADLTDAVYYLWLYGCIQSRAGRLEAALDYLGKAERDARKQRLFLLLPSILQTQADVYRQQKAWKKASVYCTRATDKAGIHGLALIRIQSLILGAQIGLERLVETWGTLPDKPDQYLPFNVATPDRPIEERVRDRDMKFNAKYADLTEQVETALVQARQCHYRWPEMDALDLLADIENLAAKHYREAASLFRNEADLLRKDVGLRLPKPDIIRILPKGTGPEWHVNFSNSLCGKMI